MSSGPPIELPRRTLLLTGGALVALTGVLSGCSGADDAGPERSGEAAATPEGLRRRAARDNAKLLARYDATTAAHPDLAGTLTPLRETLAAQLTALQEDGAPSPGSAPGVPSDADGALAELIEAERSLADERLRTLGDAPPELARLLASLSAAGSVHVYLLGEARA
ncbi:hypothetical protein [Streptomyces xiamenensis]|uniref:hypothetical protein n=1 Tax=Streptomyces xiamenensis TaxID=408015 RepID=UPI0037CCC7B7